MICVIWTLAILVAVPAGLALQVTMIPDIDSSELGSDIDLMELIALANSNQSLSAALGNFSIPMKPFCANVGLTNEEYRAYNYFLVAVQYFIPLVMVTFAYGRMGAKLAGGLTRTETGSREGHRSTSPQASSSNEAEASQVSNR